VNSEDIRTKAAWLEKLTGFKSDMPVETVDDLRVYASRADFNCHLTLTGAETGQIAEMVESLDPPEVQQARERKRQLSEERAEAWMNWRFDRGRTLSKRCCRSQMQRRRNSSKSLTQKPMREQGV
jgi:hypothetical protein